MAFDALRLRNVIQLVGILGAPLICRPRRAALSDQAIMTGFHIALIVFATIQVHETKAAVGRTQAIAVSRYAVPSVLRTHMRYC